MTTAIADLKRTVKRHRGAGAEPEDLLSFLEQRIRPRSGVAWSLESHEYLRAIALDDCRVKVIEKAAQMGASTLAIGELLQLGIAGYHVGYFLDTAARMQQFVQARLDPIINADDELVRQVVEEEWKPADRPRRRGGKGADNVRLKRIGKGRALFLSTGAMGEVKTHDLDCIMMDEVAELNETIAEFAQDRLLHSKLKRERWFSQPDVPEMDIDDYFLRSDRRYWKLRCRRCRTWTALELRFPDVLRQVRGQWRIGCPSCDLPFDPSAGEWVAMHPDRESHGYHLSQLFGPQITAAEIAQQWERAQSRPNRMRRFMISILGLPFAGDRQPITDALLNDRCGDWGISASGSGMIPMGIAYAGIDVGDVIHLAIARYQEGQGKVIWLEELSDWERLEKRLRDHNVTAFVIDARPEKTKAKELCRKLGVGALIYTGAGQQTTVGEEDADTDPVRRLSMNRTDLLDELVGVLAVGDLRLPRPGLPETQKAREHLKRLVRDRRDDGSFAYRRNVENHYALALAHMVAALRYQSALKLSPPGHFHGEQPGEQSRHIYGETFAPRRW
jgi:hypothetical protein